MEPFPCRLKKRSGLPSLGEVAEAWANSRPHPRIPLFFARGLKQEIASKPLGHITQIDLAILVNDWRQKFKANTVATYRTHLSGICKLADDLHGTRLARQVPRVPAAQLRPTTASEAEFQRLYAFASPWMRAFLLLARTLGLRRGEVLALAPNALSRDGDTLYFTRKLEGSSNLPITPDLAVIIESCDHMPDQPILQTIAGRPITAHHLNWKWKQLRDKTKVNPRLTPHDLRRTACKRAYDKTRDLRICQQLLGHRSPTSTLRYVGAFDHSELRETILATAPRLTDAIPLASERPQ